MKNHLFCRFVSAFMIVIMMFGMVTQTYAQTRFNITQIKVVKILNSPTLTYSRTPKSGASFYLQVGGTFTNTAVSSIPANPAPIVYSSSHNDIASVDQAGKVTALKPGTTAISATQPANGSYKEAPPISYLLEVYALAVTRTVKPELFLTTGVVVPAGTIPVSVVDGLAPLVFKLSPEDLPDGLKFNATNGAIEGTPTVSSPIAKTYSVTTTDANEVVSNSSNFTLTVTDKLITILNPQYANITLTAGQKGVNIIPVTTQGGVPAVTLELKPNTLPRGLSFISGAITGNPDLTQSTASEYEVTATDSKGATSTSKKFTLLVNPPVAVVLTGGLLERVVNTGDKVSFNPVSGSGGTGALTYSISPALEPLKLGVTASTGEITGIPPSAQSRSGYTVTVTDTNGVTAQKEFFLTINGEFSVNKRQSLLILTPAQTIPAGTIPVLAGGGKLPYTYSITSATPLENNGLKIDPRSGAITGKPLVKQSRTEYTVRVVDSGIPQSSGENTFELAVNDRLEAALEVGFTSPVILPNTKPVKFRPVAASGGTSPLTFTTSPQLENNLSINPTTGEISSGSGLPGGTVNRTYTVIVTDDNKVVARQAFVLTLYAPLTLKPVYSDPITLSPGFMPTGNTYHYIPTVKPTGGFGAITYALAAESPPLPKNLYIDPTNGRLRGAAAGPTGGVTGTYIITARDTLTPSAQTASGSFQLIVNQRLTSKVKEANIVLPINVKVEPGEHIPYTFQGGSAGVTPFIIYSGKQLPTGLELDPKTGAITGTPTEATSVSSYTVAAYDKTIYPHLGGGGYTYNGIYQGSPVLGTFTITVTGGISAVKQQNADRELYIDTPVAANYIPISGGGGAGGYTYSIDPDFTAATGGLTIDARTGVIKGIPTKPIDRVFTVTVEDSAGATATNTFKLGVYEKLRVTVLQSSWVLKSKETITFKPIEVTGGKPDFTYTLNHIDTSTGIRGVSFNGNTGEFTSTNPPDLFNNTYVIVVRDALGTQVVSGEFRLSSNTSLTLTPVLKEFEIATGNFANNMGQDAVLVRTTGGVGEVTYEIDPPLTSTAGPLLTFNPKLASLAGRAINTIDRIPYKIKAEDKAGNKAETTFTMTVKAPLVMTVNSGEEEQRFNLGPVRFKPVTVTGGANVTGFTVTSSAGGGLPPGLTIDADGVISGEIKNPLPKTTYTLSRTSRSLLNGGKIYNVASASFTMQAGMLTMVPVTPEKTLTVTQTNVRFTPARAEGPREGTLTYAITSSLKLPNTLTLNAGTGEITGTAGNVRQDLNTYTVTVSDQAVPSHTASADFDLEIAALPVASTASGQAQKIFAVGDESNFKPVNVVGGAAPLRYRTDPVLGNGLAINSSGAITGNVTNSPPPADNVSYRVIVTDNNGFENGANFTLNIKARLEAKLTGNIYVPLEKGVPLVNVRPVAGSGGIGDLIYSIALDPTEPDQSLPAWLNLNPKTGEITGTPSDTMDSRLFWIAVTDEATPIKHTERVQFKMGVTTR